MRHAPGLALAALVLVLAPASAGASTTRSPLGLTVSPARVALLGTGQASVRISNPGLGPVVVDVARAGFTLDLRGRPRVGRAGRRAATPWLSVKPGHFVLPTGATQWITVTSRVPRRVEPGDHDALVLLTTRPWRSAGVAVRMRIGVVVVVRAPGRVVRSVTVGALRVRRTDRTRTLELVLANRGNVTETIDASRVRLSLVRKGVRSAIRPEPRELRPRTSGIVQFRYRGKRGVWATARVRLTLERGLPIVSKSFRVKL